MFSFFYQRLFLLILEFSQRSEFIINIKSFESERYLNIEKIFFYLSLHLLQTKTLIVPVVYLSICLFVYLSVFLLFVSSLLLFMPIQTRQMLPPPTPMFFAFSFNTYEINSDHYSPTIKKYLLTRYLQTKYSGYPKHIFIY